MADNDNDNNDNFTFLYIKKKYHILCQRWLLLLLRTPSTHLCCVDSSQVTSKICCVKTHRFFFTSLGTLVEHVL